MHAKQSWHPFVQAKISKSSVSLSRTLRCINHFPIQPSFRSESNQRYWQEKCSFVSIAFNLRMTFSIGNCCTFLTIIVHFLKSIFDSNNRTSHVSYTVLQTSQEQQGDGKYLSNVNTSGVDDSAKDPRKVSVMRRLLYCSMNTLLS